MSAAQEVRQIDKIKTQKQLQQHSETPLESIRRFSTYQQLLKSYQFVNSHPNMASLLILFGIALQLPGVIYYCCYYLSYLSTIYCTVVPILYTLFNFTAVDMSHFRPPWYNFLFCVLNIASCLMSLVCTAVCFYLMLPIKGRYLATIEKQYERRRGHCITLMVVLMVSVPYQVVLSMLRSIRFLRRELEDSQKMLLLASEIRSKIVSQGNSSFWSLHAYQHLPCCFSGFVASNNSTPPLPSPLPAECCQTFGRAAGPTSKCIASADRSLLWPDCAVAIVNIIGDIEVTMDAQMQLCLLIACIVTFVMKYALHPHIRMMCVQCQHTYGWLRMRRYDN